MIRSCNDVVEIDSECAKYLKSTTGTLRIMKGLRQRYVSLSKAGGNYILNNPTDAEKEFLRGLFKKDFSDAQSISISLKRFGDAFIGTRFEGVNLPNVLACYFGEPMTTSRDAQSCREAEYDRYFAKLIEKSEHREVKEWLISALSMNRSGAYKWLDGAYQSESADLQMIIIQLNSLVELLDATKVSVARPIVAALVTKDPHSLDENRPLLKALTYFLCHRYGKPAPETALALRGLLDQAKILTDTVNNNVSTFGLKAEDESGTSLQWETFHTRREPLQIVGANLNYVNKLESVMGWSVFCFENPSVFYSFLQRYPERAFICTGGQLNQTAIQVLKLLEKGCVPVWYHGDFDPEGLLIADKLAKKFNNVRLFGYEEELYHKSKSAIVVNQARIKQLDGIGSVSLAEIVHVLRDECVAGYQEYIIEELMILYESIYNNGYR